MPGLLREGRRRGGYIGLVMMPLRGILLLVGLTLGYPSTTFPFQGEASASIFIFLCLFGALAGVYPTRVSGLLRRGKSGEKG